MRRILIAVPCHNMVHAKFTRCLMELDKPAGTAYAQIEGTLIYNARNTIAQSAVKEGFDYVLWIDSDMVFPSDTLKRLLEDAEQGLDYVSALCFSRKENSVPCIQSSLKWAVEDGNVKTSADILLDYPIDEVFEIAGSGFACVLTSAKILSEMVELYGAPFYPLMGMGEDTTFCFRAGQAGFKMYCDSRIKIGHIGEKIFDEQNYFRKVTHNAKTERLRELLRNTGEDETICLNYSQVKMLLDCIEEKEKDHERT